jgi:uncharacterized protein
MAAQQSPRLGSANPGRQKAIAATIVGASVVYLAGSLHEQRPEYGSLVVPLGHDIRVEIARTSERRSRGLSGRSQIGADGFLLVWPNAGVQPIWMADMRFALDVVWLDAEHRVLAIESNAQPCAATPCPIIQPHNTERSVYVLELPSGRAAFYLIAVGATLGPTRPESVDRINARPVSAAPPDPRDMALIGFVRILRSREYTALSRT